MSADNRKTDLASKVGEVLDPQKKDLEMSFVSAQMREEIDLQISTAKKYPRSITLVQRRVTELATLDKDTASEMIFAKPQAGEVIKGPSIRFAELVYSAWGNSRVGSRTVHVDKTFVEAEGIFHDLETNVATVKRVRRPITKRNGERYSEDMIITTANAAASIALRNAILGGVPKPIWRNAYLEVEALLKGDVKTLVSRRQAAMDYLKKKGVEAKRVFATLNVAGLEDISLEKLVDLRALTETLTNGEGSIDELFPPVEKAKTDLKDKVSGAAKDAKEDAPKEDEKEKDEPKDPKPKAGFSKDHVDKQIGKKAAPPKGDQAAADDAQAEKEEAPAEEDAKDEAPPPAEEEAAEEETAPDAEVEEEDEPEVEQTASGSFPDFWATFNAAPDWPTCKKAVAGLYGDDDFAALEDEDQAAMRRKIWARIEERSIDVDYAQEPTAFRLWMETRTGPEGADDVEAAFRVLENEPTFTAMKEANQTRVREAVERHLKRERESV